MNCVIERFFSTSIDSKIRLNTVRIHKDQFDRQVIPHCQFFLNTFIVAQLLKV